MGEINPYEATIYSNEKLKPCPFCGSEVTMHCDTSDWRHSVMHVGVRCDNSDCAAKIGFPFDYSYGIDNAVYMVRERWNRRKKDAR